MTLAPDARSAVNQIAARLSLRPPQRESLEILARIGEIIPLAKGSDVEDALRIVRSEFPQVESFERDFPSLCFALATGVGKTRLMGAFTAYLHRVHGVRHVFVLAPNLTIYNKLIADFTPGTPKYVFQGLAEFAQEPPLVITGDTYESSLAVRGADLFDRDARLHVNVFNISKLNKDARATGGAPRIKRLSEYIGQSYFEYLAGLDDLVLMMDESHRYRAEAGVRVLNELRPVLGLELTATPQVEKANRAVPFENVIYSYPLSAAIEDGFVKEPAVATRENFDARDYSPPELERLKLEDGVRLHEAVKADLVTYARQAGVPAVKPFMLVVAQDTAHADEIVRTVRDPSFFGGQYADRIIQVHSNQRGEEKEETVERLLAVESADEPTEIVVHVNMLKEGWDVTNLYTIVPLRAANSRTLVEQSIGRGLRLPFGRRTGVPAVDRLTIVSHDRFQEIVDSANDPGSIIRTGIVIGRDVADARVEAVQVLPTVERAILGASGDGAAGTVPPVAALFTTPVENAVAKTALDAVRRFQSTSDARTLPNAAALTSADVRASIVAEVREAFRPALGAQVALDGLADAPSEADVEAVVEQVVAQITQAVAETTVSLPRVVVMPKGTATAGFRDFDLDLSGIRLQPVAQNVLVQHLQSGTQHRLATSAGVAAEERPEDYVVRHLIDFPDIAYEAHAALLYTLAGQVVAHLKSYLPDADGVENVLQYHGKRLAETVHAQMERHFTDGATEYEATVTRGAEPLKPLNFTTEADAPVYDVHAPVANKSEIRKMTFGGFKTCLYDRQRFDSDAERQLASILERDQEVTKWFRPVPDQLHIYYRHDRRYDPDAVAETASARYLIETKRRDEMDDEDVRDKAVAARAWCAHATAYAASIGDLPWHYLLIPHDDVRANYTLAGLAAKYA